MTATQAPRWLANRRKVATLDAVTRSSKLTAAVPALLSLLVSATLMASCGLGATPAAPAGDVTLERGREVYIKNCSSCHGASGGGGRGKKLNEGKVLEAFPDIADELIVITDGRGSMPSFAGRLTEEDREAVARFTREVLAVEQAADE